MLKKMGIRKFAVTTSALLVVLLIYLFPLSTDVTNDKKIEYVDESALETIYLLDQNNYVSEVEAIIEEKDLENILRKKLELITINNETKDEIKDGFKPIIPKNTKILNIKIENDTCTVDFSKELLNISKLLEEKLISSIIYTLTSEKEINKVIIKVEGKNLERLPNSNTLLPNILDRTYGINKNYDINNLYDLTKTTIYYIGEYDGSTYYVPVTKINNTNEEKINIIVNELKSSVLYQSNLSSYLSSNAELKKYEILEDAVSLTFNDKIFESIYNENILEEVVYTIGMSILENYDVEKVMFYVDDKEILTFKQ